MLHSLGCGCHLTFISSFTCILLLCTWSPRGEWPLSPLGNSLLLRSGLIPIHEWWVYFPRLSYQSIPLNFSRELIQVLDNTAMAHYKVEARYVSLQVLIVYSFSYMIMHANALYLCICFISYLTHTCMHTLHGHNIYLHIYSWLRTLYVLLSNIIVWITSMYNICNFISHTSTENSVA